MNTPSTRCKVQLHPYDNAWHVCADVQETAVEPGPGAIDTAGQWVRFVDLSPVEEAVWSVLVPLLEVDGDEDDLEIRKWRSGTSTGYAKHPAKDGIVRLEVEVEHGSVCLEAHNNGHYSSTIADVKNASLALQRALTALSVLQGLE